MSDSASDVITQMEDLSPECFRWWCTPFKHFAPPPSLTIDAWADSFRRISEEFSASPGTWSTARVPYLKAPMQAASPSHPCRRVVLLKCAQAGGSEAMILNTLGHMIDVFPRSALLVLPTVDMGESFSRERLELMIRSMPRLRGKVSEAAPGPGTERSSVKRKRFPGGWLIIAGANSQSGLASRPVGLALMDEVDACLENSGQAGDPTRLMAMRTQTFSDAKQIFVGSPSRAPEEHGIWSLWENSNQGVLERQCPGCGAWECLSWERMNLETAQVACSSCREEFGQHEWQRGEAFLRWTFLNPSEESAWGFRLGGLDSPWLQWKRDLVDDYHECKKHADRGNHQLLRVFFNSKLGLPYRPISNVSKLDLFDIRREPYPCHQLGAELPDGAIIVTAGIDIMDRFIAYELIAWGKGKEAWGIEAGRIHGETSNPDGEVWKALDRFVCYRLLRYSDGTIARVRMACLDTGGHSTSAAYQYCARRRGRVAGIKGQGGVGRPAIARISAKDKHGGFVLLRLGVDGLKQQLYDALEVLEPGPGFWHFPGFANGEPCCGYTESFFQELIAEQKILKFNAAGFASYTWTKARETDNHAMDCRVYSMAAVEFLRTSLEKGHRDIVRNLAPENVERIELGPGRAILCEKPGAKPSTPPRQYGVREQSRTISGSEPEPQTQWTGSAGQPPKPRVRYGAIGGSF